jgi:peroxiredoxin Q/BCP
MLVARIANLALGVMMAASAGVGHVSAAELEVGDRAPGFELPGSDGKSYSLEQFEGQRAVVLAWFPKAFTGG